MPATDAVPLAALSPRHLVLRRLDLEMSGNASRSPSGIAIDTPAQVQSAAQQGQSADDCVASLDERRARSRVHKGAPREYAGWSARIRTNTTMPGRPVISLRPQEGVVNHARLAAFPNSNRETRENQGEPAEGRVNPLVAKALLLLSRPSASPVSTVPLTDPRNIVAPERSQVSEMQRQSEPQEIADEIDNLIPFVRRNFEASNGIDQHEQAILDGLEEVSNQSIRYAEVIDLTASMMRRGHNKRNNRRIRELFPDFGPEAA